MFYGGVSILPRMRRLMRIGYLRTDKMLIANMQFSTSELSYFFWGGENSSIDVPVLESLFFRWHALLYSLQMQGALTILYHGRAVGDKDDCLLFLPCQRRDVGNELLLGFGIEGTGCLVQKQDVALS